MDFVVGTFLLIASVGFGTWLGNTIFDRAVTRYIGTHNYADQAVHIAPGPNARPLPRGGNIDRHAA